MISIASSIKFREVIDGALASFDSTFHEDEAFANAAHIPYWQKVYATDTVTIQVKVLTGQTVTVEYTDTNSLFIDNLSGWMSLGGESLKISGTVYDIYEVEIDFSSFRATYLKFQICTVEDEAIVETWISEPVEILQETDPDLQLIEFFNYDNAFEVDYSTDICHQLRVTSYLKEYKPGGDVSVFDNQNEVTKIKDEVKRILVFRTDPIPRYLFEMLRMAFAHDKLFVNEVEFTAESLPEIDNDSSNLVIFTANLTQRNVIGLNTHDVGFDCDSATTNGIMVMQEEEASGQVTFVIPDGYLIAYVTGYRTAGDPVIKAGTSVGGDEVVTGMNLSATNPYETYNVGYPLSAGDHDLYVDISGSGATATIIVLLIYNRET